ncbi:MAG: HD domain-containing protein [Thermodesulfovibrionales bacterium]|nr:HD domain-containing protein [Thermodesulfovibrionales bacterium]
MISRLNKIKIRIFENIRFKLALFLLAVLVVTTFIFYIFIVRMTDQYVLNELIKRGESLGRSTAVSAAHSMLLGDWLGIDAIITKLQNLNTDIEYIAVVNAADTVITHSDPAQRGMILKPATGTLLKETSDHTVIKEISDASRNYFEIVTPIMFKEKQLGTVLVGMNKSLLIDLNQRARRRILTGFAVTLFLGIIGIVVLSAILTRPIHELSAGVDEIKKGKRSNPLRVYSKDELGRLTENFNEMSRLIHEQKQSLNTYAQELEEAYVATVQVLAAAIDARDPYTLGHSTRVAGLSMKVGQALGLGKKELDDLEIACLFHDVGKIKTPDIILNKRDKLDTSEYGQMMHHPEIGAEILSKAPSLVKYIPAVKHHHEWFNGEGYPDGLSKDQIPFSASIIAIADAYDAMTSQRPYRNALSEEEAFKELLNYSGTQFDPLLVKIFIEAVRDNKILPVVRSLS